MTLIIAIKPIVFAGL